MATKVGAKKPVVPVAGNYMGTNISQAVNPTLTGNLQTDQNAANQANTGRYNQGLENLIQGYNSGGQTYNQALASSQQYGQTAQNNLNLQYQKNLGSQTQSAVSRGLANTTIADTMKDLPTRQYNDATLQNNEQIANRQTQLLTQQAQNQQQGANQISQYIASKNDVAPNASMYTDLAKQAASNPGHQNVSIPGSMGSGGGSDFGSGGGQKPLTSNGGGAGSASGSNQGQLYYPAGSIGGGGGGGGSQGYQGGSIGGGSGSTAGLDENGMPIQSGSQTFFGNGSSAGQGTPMASAAPGMPSGAQQGQVAKAAPASISTAVQAQSQPACAWYDQMTGSCPPGSGPSTTTSGYNA